MGFLPPPPCGSKRVLRVYGEEGREGGEEGEGEGGSSLSHEGHFIWDGAVKFTDEGSFSIEFKYGDHKS